MFKFLNKTIEYGLYLLVFLLPLQTRWIIKAGATEYAAYSLYGTDILLVLLLLLFIIQKFSIFNYQFSNNFQLFNFQIKYKIQNFLIFGLVLMSAVSIFFAGDKLLALYKLGWLILGVGLFWLIANANYDKLKLIYALLAGIFLQAGLGVWQFLTQSSFSNKWLGLAFHNAADLGASVVGAVGADGIGERWLRAYGGLDHPNIFGGALAIGVLLAIGEIIKLDKFSIFNFQFSNNFQFSIFKYINRILLIVFITALFFSFSRSAWLGLAVGLAGLLMLAVINKNLKSQKSLAETILIMGVILFILFSQYQNLITSRLGGEGRLEEKSTSERLTSYNESWQMIKNNWLFGVGLGNYTLALKQQIPNQEVYYYQPAHNVFLLVWAETGIIGLIFFIALLFVIASDRRERGNLTYSEFNQRLLRRYASRNDNIILIALIIIMSLDHWPWSLHFGVLFFWLIAGLAFRATSNNEKNNA